MIIGITGKSGVGKSTISEFISHNLEKSKIIHIDSLHMDYLLTQAKRLKELYRDSIIVDNNLNGLLLTSYPEKLSLIFKETYIEFEKILLKEIKSIQKSYDWIILDFFVLPNLQSIWNLCDYRILVELSSDDERYKRIISRSKNTDKSFIRAKDIRAKEDELRSRDIFLPNFYDFNYDYYVMNNSNENFQNNMNCLIKDLKMKQK